MDGAVDGEWVRPPARGGLVRRFFDGLGWVVMRWDDATCSVSRRDATLVDLEAEGAVVVAGCGPLRRWAGEAEHLLVQWEGNDRCTLLALWVVDGVALASAPVVLARARGERRSLTFVASGPAPTPYEHVDTLLGSDLLSGLARMEDTGMDLTTAAP